MNIHWTILDTKNSVAMQEKVECINLLQSYVYIKTQQQRNNQLAKLGTITRDDKIIGYAIMLEAKLWRGLVHGMIVDRAPLWLKGHDTLENNKAFFALLSKQFPSRFGRMRRIMPEIKNVPQISEIMKENDFKRRAEENYRTIVLDITRSEEDLLKAMRRDWRASLKKAERLCKDKDIQWDPQGISWPFFAKNYDLDKKQKTYKGPSVKLLTPLVKNSAQTGDLIVGYVEKDDSPVAGVLILCHGNMATYQAGWNLTAGREIFAHHRLLWEAIKTLKSRNISYFDLGGIHEEGAAGVTEFKKGLAGKKADILELCGLYS